MYTYNTYTYMYKDMYRIHILLNITHANISIVYYICTRLIYTI